jgi:ribokinase
LSASNLSGVAVVGSANLDVVVSLARVPERGETVFGTGYDEYQGGKGANQAVAAARSSRTSFIASVGLDAAAQAMIGYLEDHDVDTTHTTAGGASTGRAFITVTPDGENSITVLPLANDNLTAEAVTTSLDAVRPKVVLTQHEVPLGAIAAAAEWCARHSARFVLNASPVAPLTPNVIGAADPLVVNELEAKSILGTDYPPNADLASVARTLLSKSRSVVLTAGSRGAFVARGGTVTKIRGETVTPIDTTGAGDEFAGTLVASLANGVELLEASAQANAAAARIIGIPRIER